MKRVALTRRLAALAALTLALMLGATVAPALAAGGASATTANSLTSQYPLGRSTLCCRSTPRPASATASRARRGPAGSQRHASSTPGLWLVIGAPVLVILVALLMGGGSEIAWRRKRSRRTRRQKGRKPRATNGSAQTATSNGHVSASEKPFDPLQGLDLELLTDSRWEAEAGPRAGESSSALSDGEGVYRFGVILYERGQVDQAVAAWRLAVARQHPKAAIRLGMVLEERGDHEAAARAYRDAESWGADPAAARRGVARP